MWESDRFMSPVSHLIIQVTESTRPGPASDLPFGTAKTALRALRQELLTYSVLTVGLAVTPK